MPVKNNMIRYKDYKISFFCQPDYNCKKASLAWPKIPKDLPIVYGYILEKENVQLIGTFLGTKSMAGKVARLSIDSKLKGLIYNKKNFKKGV